LLGKNEMHALWKFWTDACQVGLDAQQVIAMRLVRLSAGGAAAEAECGRMVSEKVSAAIDAQAASAAALVAGKGLGAAATAALAPVMQAVQANHRRLSQAARIGATIITRRSR
jgi:hypothetical protein